MIVMMELALNGIGALVMLSRILMSCHDLYSQGYQLLKFYEPEVRILTVIQV